MQTGCCCGPWPGRDVDVRVEDTESGVRLEVSHKDASKSQALRQFIRAGLELRDPDCC